MPTMKSDPKTNAPSPFENFTRAMDYLVTVPRSTLKARLDAEKRSKARKRKSKKTSASRVSSNPKD
jgi:hypothetical protein